MRRLLFTTGSPFARAVRIVLDELGLDYERREEITTPTVEERASATPTLQVPTYWDGSDTLWESGLIAEYLLEKFEGRPDIAPPLSPYSWRPGKEWHDKLIFSTVQTFGNAATTISQMKWGGVNIEDSAHLERSAEKLTQILSWLEKQLPDHRTGFMPDCISIQDIFLAAHVRFVQARPLGVELALSDYPKIDALLSRLDERASFKANPIWWWEPGVTGYEPDGTPVYSEG